MASNTKSATVTFEWNRVSTEEIVGHLRRCSDSFSPPLSTSVLIEKYANKIRANAETAEAWAKDGLVGLAAVYLNDMSTMTGFVTNVSVERRFQRKGVASELMRRVCDEAMRRGFRSLILEVSKANTAGKQLYSRCGFIATEDAGEKVVMVKRLDEKQNRSDRVESM